MHLRSILYFSLLGAAAMSALSCTGKSDEGNVGVGVARASVLDATLHPIHIDPAPHKFLTAKAEADDDDDVVVVFKAGDERPQEPDTAWCWAATTQMLTKLVAGNEIRQC